MDLRRARRGAPMRRRRSEREKRAAERHDEGAEPDQPHERIEVEAHDEAAAGELIAEHGVEVAAPGDVDAGFRGGLARSVEGALGGVELGDRACRRA